MTLKKIKKNKNGYKNEDNSKKKIKIKIKVIKAERDICTWNSWSDLAGTVTNVVDWIGRVRGREIYI